MRTFQTSHDAFFLTNHEFYLVMVFSNLDILQYHDNLIRSTFFYFILLVIHFSTASSISNWNPIVTLS